MKKCLLALALLLVATASFAAEEPLFSPKRLSVAAGANYASFSQVGISAAQVPAYRKEWEVGVYSAYNLTPRASLVASSVLGLDNRLVRWSAGFRIRMFRGGEK